MDNMETLVALCMCHCSLITADACPKSSNGKCTVLDCATCLASHLIGNGVVPVVRCKDCAYMPEAKVNKKGFLICPASGMEITDEDFCSYGERREP